MFFYKKTIYVVVKFIQFWVLRYFLSHDMPDQRYRSTDIFNVAINMSGLMIKMMMMMMMMNDSSFKFKYVI